MSALGRPGPWIDGHGPFLIDPGSCCWLRPPLAAGPRPLLPFSGRGRYGGHRLVPWTLLAARPAVRAYVVGWAGLVVKDRPRRMAVPVCSTAVSIGRQGQGDRRPCMHSSSSLEVDTVARLRATLLRRLIYLQIQVKRLEISAALAAACAPTNSLSPRPGRAGKFCPGPLLSSQGPA